MIKRITFLLVLCLIFSNNLHANAQENMYETQYEYHEEFLQDKFKEIFPEYSKRIEECDNLLTTSKSDITSLSVESVAQITESITRYDGDDMYALTFYSDGGYSEVALLSESVSIEFEQGTATSTLYKNCKVYTYLSDPGLISYSGGMIGDGISYYKSGSFLSNGYGNYINAGVMSGYESNVTFVSRTGSQLKVSGVATAMTLGGEYTTILAKPTLLTIRLVANGNPQITFGYL